MSKLNNELMIKFEKHAISWFEENEIEGHTACQLLGWLLCNCACIYEYTQEEFEDSLKGLSTIFKHQETLYRIFNEDKSKAR